MTDFTSILQTTLTPIALISGVGLLLLSMVNRYNHAIDRVRYLLKEREALGRPLEPKLDRSIEIIFKRCRVMKNAILCIGGSIVSSGALVLVTAVEGLTGFNLHAAKAVLLLLSVALVVVAAVLFVMEITYSLHAIRLEMDRTLQ